MCIGRQRAFRPNGAWPGPHTLSTHCTKHIAHCSAHSVLVESVPLLHSGGYSISFVRPSIYSSPRQIQYGRNIVTNC
jgi:hypothetical protein